MQQKQEKEQELLKPLGLDNFISVQNPQRLVQLKQVQDLANELDTIKNEPSKGAPSDQIADQQQRIAGVIMKTAQILDTDQETDKDVQTEANNVIQIANLMTDQNNDKLAQLKKPQAQQSGELTPEQMLNQALGMAPAPKPKDDVKSEVLSQILNVMDQKDKFHQEVMFGTAKSMSTTSPTAFMQRSKPLSKLEQDSEDFMKKISSFDFGISYNQQY